MNAAKRKAVRATQLTEAQSLAKDTHKQVSALRRKLSQIASDLNYDQRHSDALVILEAARGLDLAYFKRLIKKLEGMK